jgi:hypothetical protein
MRVLGRSVTGIGQVRTFKTYNTQSYPKLERTGESRKKLVFYLQNREYEHYLDESYLSAHY